MQVVEGELDYKIEYIGRSRWSVVKTCTVNPSQGGAWLYYEKSDKMIWNQDMASSKL